MHAEQMKRPKPLVLIVLDGLGVAPAGQGNAVTQARPANLEGFWQNFPHCYLQASGTSVGLPQGVVGNSEVGHMALGAGKVIFQEVAKIDREIESRNYYRNQTLKEAAEHAKKNNGMVHLMGLLSDGRVHASIEHAAACLEFCKNEGIKGDKVALHVFTDGRDAPPQSAEKYITQIEKHMKRTGTGIIASVVGRYFAMDRDNRWDRTKMAYDMIVQGVGTHAKNWGEAIQSSYGQNKTDEFVEPYVIVKGDKAVATVNSGDACIFFNYRADRAVQLSKAFEDDPFTGWQRNKIENLYFAGFSNYEKGIPMNRAKEDIETAGNESAMVKDLFAEELQKTETGFPAKQVFPPEKVQYSLGRLVSDSGLRQLRIAESEKYPHVTYFFNCRMKNPFRGEDRLEIPSPKEVATYDQKPEMSAHELTATLISKIGEDQYDFILVNYANTDMVPHTGNLDASVSSVVTVDQCMGQVVNAVLDKGGAALITADHGNAEELINIQTGEKDTEHSTNPVPFVYVEKGLGASELSFGLLADVAPTILAKLGIQQPDAMTGRNLLL